MQKDGHRLSKLQKTIRFYSFRGIWYFSMKSILAITSSFIPVIPIEIQIVKGIINNF